MMKQLSKRIFSALLVTVILISILPMGTFTVSAAYAPGDIITYGSYPQTKVTDSELITELNAQTLSPGNTVTYEGEKYLRVYFSEYISYVTVGTVTDPSLSYQDDNGYYINTVYWFRYEPVQWRVLSNINDELFVMAEKILATRAFNVYNGTWETCTIRTWLNNDFYNTAFSSTEQTKIRTSTVVNNDNPWYGTDGGNDTNDKLFLLSSSDVTNPAYGFGPASISSGDPARRAQGSDFAKSGGLLVENDGYYIGDAGWWLRTPGYYAYDACYVTAGFFDANFYKDVSTKYIGVRPAFKMDITYQQTFDAAGGSGSASSRMEPGATLTAPAVTRAGFTFAGWSPEVPATVPEADATYTAQWISNALTTGDTIEFGSYPQTRVTDAGLIAALNDLVGPHNTTITYGGSKYQAVILSEYKSFWAGTTGSVSNSNQPINGYYVGNIYWFKIEPIQWRVLSNTNGELFVVAQNILDSREYHLLFNNVTWETCTLRSWLNDDFYSAAFNLTEQARIKTSALINDDNPWYGTEGGNLTNDKLFLLSYGDVMTPALGFGSGTGGDTARQAWGSDYAKCQGLGVSDTGEWRLRSPGNVGNWAGEVRFLGDLYFEGGSSGDGVHTTYVGVRPAFKMDLDYQITFDSAGGSPVEPVTQAFATDVTAPADPERTGYTFNGWDPPVPETMPVNGVACVAQWSINSYTIAFDSAGGSPVDPITQPFGSAVTPPEAPVKTGYTFVWSPAIPATMPAENLTCAAQWTANRYNINFNANSGSGTMANSAHTYDIAKNLTANGFSKAGYSFMGWSLTSLAQTPEFANGQSILNLTAVNGEIITLYAVWSINHYNIVFNANGGIGGTSASMASGESLTAPVVTRAGFTFAGWSQEVPNTVPAGDNIYTAQWISNSLATGDIIEFGSYPQTRVTDSGLINALNQQAFPADKTLTYAGSKYKLVNFMQYRPMYFGSPSSPYYYNSYQGLNGYYRYNYYYFKYEPIEWRVLSNTNNELFLVANKILDSKEYDQRYDYITWENCTLRTWLNSDFYNSAFISNEQLNIKTNTVINEDNPWYGTDGGNNTNDKLFLLSHSEVTNPAYGFSSDPGNDGTRLAWGSDYSKSQGLNFVDTGKWSLRTQGNHAGGVFRSDIVNFNGAVDSNNSDTVNATYIGVRPAIKIKLSSGILTAKYGTNCVVNSSNNFVYGLAPGITSLDDYAEAAAGYALSVVPTAGGFGTGTVVNATFGGETMETYQIVIFGDVNGDGTITSIDALMTLQAASGKITLEPSREFAADINISTSITSIDALMVLQCASGKISISQNR